MNSRIDGSKELCFLNRLIGGYGGGGDDIDQLPLPALFFLLFHEL